MLKIHIDEYENAVTREIAKTYGFELKETHARCKRCNSRFFYRYTGKPINERMQDHAEWCRKLR